MWAGDHAYGRAMEQATGRAGPLLWPRHRERSSVGRIRSHDQGCFLVAVREYLPSRVAAGVLPAPLLYLSAFFEATHVDYYNGLRGISEKGDWPGWLQYFLNAAARQAEDAVSRAERINGLLARWRNEVSGDVHAKVALG